MKSQPKKPKVPFSKLYTNADPKALDLLDKMLMFDPAQRISVEDALAHPYLESLHNVDDEPEADNVFSFEFEKEKLTKRRLQELIFDAMCSFHPSYREELDEAQAKGPDAIQRDEKK